jgi:hypothetical protein
MKRRTLTSELKTRHDNGKIHEPSGLRLVNRTRAWEACADRPGYNKVEGNPTP